MAELVDALVSNTNEAIRAGSIPARGTEKGVSFLRLLFLFKSNKHTRLTFFKHTSKNKPNRGIRLNTYATFSRRNAMFGTQVHIALQQDMPSQNACYA